MASIRVYDKAEYHYESKNYPKDLPKSQAYVHTGMYLGWVIDQELYSEEFEEDCEDQIAAFKRREISGPRIYAQCDGVFASDMLNEDGNDFTQAYFDFQTGKFLNNYEETLASDSPTIFNVADTWENYDRLKTTIDKAFADWRKRRKK